MSYIDTNVDRLHSVEDQNQSFPEYSYLKGKGADAGRNPRQAPRALLESGQHRASRGLERRGYQRIQRAQAGAQALLGALPELRGGVPEADRPGRRLGVARKRLGRRQGQRRAGDRLQGCQGADLDGVAERRACAVHLRQGQERQVRAAQRRRHDRGLRRPGGGRQSGGAPVLVGRGAGQTRHERGGS